MKNDVLNRFYFFKLEMTRQWQCLTILRGLAFIGVTRSVFVFIRESIPHVVCKICKE